ncbi:MAG: DUF4430 domain-containing protein [Ruminococcus sp.]|nr:DUF4430 domain-containing protein [Ruminococcus sp.]
MNEKGFSANFIIKYIKKNKLYFGGALIAVVLLVTAFFTGGSLSATPQASSNIPVSVSSTKDETFLDKISTEPVLTSDNKKDVDKKDEKDNKKNTNSNSSTSAVQNATDSQNNVDKSSSGINSQISLTDNSVSNSQSSSNVSPYSKEYYYQNSSETSDSNFSSNAQPSNSNSSSNNKDKHNTDPVPPCKPQPVEPQDQEIVDNELTCTISISCATILNNLDKFNPEKIELVPEDGWILKPTKVTFNEGESAYDLLVRVCKENKIHMSAKWTPLYNSHYIESINNIKEFDCPTDRFHNTSGWMYCVNGWYPNYGVSRYELKKDDIVEFNYSCVGLGADLGAEYATGG